MFAKITHKHWESPLGPMILGTTSRGVCFLEWHDRGGIRRILERVQKRYHVTSILGEHRHLDQLESELKLYFDGKLKEFKTPIDVMGTKFELLDWQQLMAIPYGETRSYGEIAKALGTPGGSRAVGRANGANYLGIVIPCHRVIESSGALRGYGGGLWRKEKLLRLEGSWPIEKKNENDKVIASEKKLSLFDRHAD